MINYLQVENLTKSYGDLVLFDNISFTIGEGQRIALIGRNGSGKTTLLNILAGKDTADSGTITPRRDLRIAYLEQNPEYAADLTVLEACFRSDNPALRAIAAYEQAVADPAQDGLQEAMSRMDALAAWDYEQRAKEILSRLKINDFDKKIGQLSGGQLKRVALAAVLISEADLLILDEPTNHLDTDMTEWLEEYLTRNKAALLMVTHDRYFLDRVCSDILEVDQRSISLYKGNYAYYVEKKQERAEAAEARRESDLNLYRRELEWMRRQPQARATKARARIDSFHELETRLRSTRTQASLKLDVQATRIGTKIFEAKELCKRFGDLVILDRFNYNFARYDKLGIVGDNGCGKSTFLKLLTGIIQPDSGTIEVGESVRFGYYSQQGLDFDEGKRVIDIVTDIAHEIHLGDGRRMSASQFLQYFLFPPEVQYSYVARLSGGERKRLYLCTILMQSPNFLILDEPTAVLTPQETEKLFSVIRNMKADGKAVIIITHKLHEVLSISDRVAILRKGTYVGDIATRDADEAKLTEMMVGEKVELNIDRPEPVDPVKRLDIQHLTVHSAEGITVLDDASFPVYGGEILGIAGISGNGQKELLEAIAGLQPTESGASIEYYAPEASAPVQLIGKSPKAIREAGIHLSFVPEDRLGMGLVGSMGMTDNMMLKSYGKGHSPIVDRKAPHDLAETIKKELGVVTPDLNTPVSRLSGGNVQKVLVGRELAADPIVLMTAYAVRGLDINTSYTIYHLLNEQKKRGVAVIYVGEDLDVLLELCDRIVVLCGGKVNGILDGRKTTKEEVGLRMTNLVKEEQA